MTIQKVIKLFPRFCLKQLPQNREPIEQCCQAIREYLNALEQGVEQYELTVEQRELLRWGRAKADWIDPLKPGVVDVLDEEIVIPK
ncbi:hypothetical protein [Pseudomonas grimontii]|uniref:hypothetical protein n=1 Tax=Pseudomonas grimontii TaxID=129847 RepID=UPI00387B93AD